MVGVAGVTGATVWDSAVVLSQWCAAEAREVRGKRCLELGSGTGLVGLAAAAVGAKSCVLTDLPEMLDLLRSNAAAAAEARDAPALGGSAVRSVRCDVSVAHYSWGDTPPVEPVDVVLAADVVYGSIDTDLLVTALCDTVAPDGCALIAVEVRDARQYEEFASKVSVLVSPQLWCVRHGLN